MSDTDSLPAPMPLEQPSPVGYHRGGRHAQRDERLLASERHVVR